MTKGVKGRGVGSDVRTEPEPPRISKESVSQNLRRDLVSGLTGSSPSRA